MHAFRDLETAAYCPRKLYYRWRDPEERPTPESVRKRRALAAEYDRLLDSRAAREAAPIAVPPATYRERLLDCRDRLDRWDALLDPARTDATLAGREARGVAHKVLADPPVPSLAFAGAPPEQGVWEPQTVRVVAAAKALAWEEETEIERGFAEYPAHGVIREVPLTTRRLAAYREAVRIADSLDGPPPRLSGSSKCGPCEYSDRCGVRTRSMRSLLG